MCVRLRFVPVARDLIYVFYCILMTQPEMDQTEVLAAFEVFDQNGNGYMPLQELVHVLKNLGEGTPDHILKAMEQVAEPDDEQQV